MNKHTLLLNALCAILLLFQFASPSVAQIGGDPLIPPSQNIAGGKPTPQVVETETPPVRKEAEAQPLAVVGSLLYAVTDSSLYVLNSVNGVATYIGSTGYSNLTDVAYDGSTLFASTFDYLLSLNPSTGVASYIGSFGYSVNALAAGPNGVLYALSQAGAILSVDKYTGAATYLGYLGTGSGGDLAFLGDRLFATTSDSPSLLAEIFVSYGTALIIGSTGYTNVYGLAESDGYIYGNTSTGYYIRINTSTGAGTYISNNGLVIMGMASAPFLPAVPNDDYDQAAQLNEPPANGLASQILQLDTRGATVAVDDPDMGCGVGTNSNTVWYQITPTYYGSLRVRTFSELDPASNSTYDTVLAAFTGSRGALNWITCNDDTQSSLSEMIFDVEPGVTYYIEVAAYGSIPSGGTLSLFYNYQVDPKAWTLMFYMAADNDNDMVNVLSRQYDQLPDLANNLHVNLVGLWEDTSLGEGFYNAFTPWGIESVPQGELNTGDPATLVDFMEWAVTNYPAEHYALVIADHGHGASGIAQDIQGNGSGPDILTVMEMKLALQNIRAPWIDVLYTEACLMATVEMGYQLRGEVDIFVASEAESWLPVRPDIFINGFQSIPAIRSSTTSQELGEAIARGYTAEYAKNDTPSNISVVHITEAGQVAARTSELAAALRAQMSSLRATLEEIRVDVQHFEENGDNVINDRDRLVDLYHFASLVQSRISNVSIQTAAGNLMSALESYVLYEQHWSGTPNGSSNFWTHNDSHGVSILFPRPEYRSCYYNSDWLDFASGSDWYCNLREPGRGTAAGDIIEWGPMLVDFTLQSNPSAPESWSPPELVAPRVEDNDTSIFAFLPLVIKGWTGEPQILIADSLVSDAELGNIQCNSWTTCRDSAYGNYLVNSYPQGTIGADYGDAQYSIRRIFLNLDTSALPAGAVITGAKLTLFAGPYQTGNTTIHLVRSTASIPLTNDDFGHVVFIGGGSAAASANSWLEIILNPIALGWIEKDGVTKLALVHAFDLLNTAPTIANNLLLSLAEDGAYAPFLLVEYYMP